jgi:hypothetical protein
MLRLSFAWTLLLFSGPRLLAAESKPNTLTPEEIAAGWLMLFDGETTFGWKTAGQVQAADGALQIGGGPHRAFTSPTAQFGNYELRFEYRYLDGTGIAYVKAVKEPDELSLETIERGASTALVLSAADRWNSFVLTVEVGPHRGETMSGSVKTEEGIVIANAMWSFPAPRRLAILAEARHKIAIRDVRLRPLGLQALFNGKDLAGWKEFPNRKSKFTVNEKGELNVQDGPGDLQTEGQWDDFVLQLDCISHGKHLNSGIFFRCLPGQYQQGYEAQIRNQWEGEDRTKPVDFGTGALYRRQAARKVVPSDNEWFTMTVVARGNRLGVWVNGYQVTDFVDERPPHENARNGAKTGKGAISIQGHDPTTNLSFRNIRVAALPKPPEKP